MPAKKGKVDANDPPKDDPSKGVCMFVSFCFLQVRERERERDRVVCFLTHLCCEQIRTMVRTKRTMTKMLSSLS